MVSKKELLLDIGRIDAELFLIDDKLEDIDKRLSKLEKGKKKNATKK